MKTKKKPSGVRHLLDYLEKSKGPQVKKKEKELLLREYQSGAISLEEYQKKLEELVLK